MADYEDMPAPVEEDDYEDMPAPVEVDDDLEGMPALVPRDDDDTDEDMPTLVDPDDDYEGMPALVVDPVDTSWLDIFNLWSSEPAWLHSFRQWYEHFRAFPALRHALPGPYRTIGDRPEPDPHWYIAYRAEREPPVQEHECYHCGNRLWMGRTSGG